MSDAHYVFGYGSLAAGAGAGEPVTRTRRREGFVADLAGWARGWGVAMDNALDLPGYKCYTEPGGARPAVFVCFLDIAESPGESVNGVCRPVSAAQLLALDARERNYERVEVTAGMSRGAQAGWGTPTVWAYVGSPAGRARFREGVARGAAVVQDAYLSEVRAAFAALGEREYTACRDSLDPGPIPVRALIRSEL